MRNLDENTVDNKKPANRKFVPKKNKPANGERPAAGYKPANGERPAGYKPANKERVEGNKPANGEKSAEGYKPNKGYKKPPYRGPKTKGPKEELEVTEKEINENMLYGRNSIMELLKTERDIDKLMIQKGELEGSIKKIISDAKARGIVIIEAEKSKLDDLTQGARHQGVVAFVSAQQYVTIDEILNDAKSKQEDPFILILENVQDPHNLGAIIRSAHNAGVHGIIISKRRAVGLTATVSKSSAGALEYMKIAKVTNIGQTIDELKQKGIWIACGDMGGKIMYQDNLKGAIGIVIGGEGDGVSKLVKEKCDFTISIPMYGKVTSLNASVAASIMAYEVVRQRHF